MAIMDLSANEFNPYYGQYIELAKEHPLLKGLEASMTETIAFLEAIPSDRLEYRYDSGKWTIKEIIRHLIDTERVFAYRAMRFARNDKTELPGFDQDAYILPSKANEQSLSDLLKEYRSVRLATIAMFQGFNDTMLRSKGTANKSPMSVRAAGFVIIGHEKHHANVIRKKYM